MFPLQLYLKKNTVKTASTLFQSLKKNTITGQRKPQKSQLLQNMLLTLIIKI